MKDSELNIGLQSVGQPSHWRWYHFYFVLAAVDLLLIASSLVLFHQTSQSYDTALQKFRAIHTRQRWVANLRIAVTNLNAPGNDVFESQDISLERGRFETQLGQVNSLLAHEQDQEVDLTRFRPHLEAMIVEERRIFEELGDVARTSRKKDDPQTLLSATAAMAAMDRHQARALTALTQIEQVMLMRVESLLNEYGAFLTLGAVVEKFFLAAVVLILVAMFWYGGKLQRMNERMLAEHQRTLLERTGRLAAVGEVCTAVAHGIRNPLAAISSSAQLAMLQLGENEHHAERLVDILTECKRLDLRITRLLSFAAASPLGNTPYDITDAVLQSIKEIQQRLEERRIRQEISFESSPLLVLGDRERMVQAFIEILSNSLEFAPEGGSVFIGIRRLPEKPGFAEAVFADSGPGIPESIRNRVFDLFFTTRPSGTGVGLASVKHTVQACDGTVSVGMDSNKRPCIRLVLRTAD